MHHSDRCTTAIAAPWRSLHHGDRSTTAIAAPRRSLHHGNRCTTLPRPLHSTAYLSSMLFFGIPVARARASWILDLLLGFRRCRPSAAAGSGGVARLGLRCRDDIARGVVRNGLERICVSTCFLSFHAFTTYTCTCSCNHSTCTLL